MTDDVVAGYELASIPPEADLETARSYLEEALLAAGQDATEEELAWLRVTTLDLRDFSPKQKTLMIAAYSEALADYPVDVIRGACRDRRNQPRFRYWPDLLQLVHHADALMKERVQLQRALSPEAVEQARRQAKANAKRREGVLAYQAERQRRLDEAAAWRRENPGPYPDPAIPRPLARDLTTADISRSLREAEQGIAAFSMIAEDDPRLADICAKWGLEPTELRVRHSAPRRARSGQSH